MRQRRNSIGYGAQKRASICVAKRILHTAIYQRSQTIACYSAVGGEIDVDFLIKKAWSQGKHCYLPVIRGQKLVFVHYTPTTRMERNRFSIPEPSSGKLIASYDIDLLLAPLVAFDRNNHRIGMGGGYYDRTFANRPLHRRVTMMGVAYRFQQVQAITPEPWDVSLDRIITN